MRYDLSYWNVSFESCFSFCDLYKAAWQWSGDVYFTSAATSFFETCRRRSAGAGFPAVSGLAARLGADENDAETIEYVGVEPPVVLTNAGDTDAIGLSVFTNDANCTSSLSGPVIPNFLAAFLISTGESETSRASSRRRFSVSRVSSCFRRLEFFIP